MNTSSLIPTLVGYPYDLGPVRSPRRRDALPRKRQRLRAANAEHRPRDTAFPQRVLATMLFTDIVGSTELVARIGDAAWRDLLRRHHAIVRRELARHQGRELDTAGDGFFATFDGPARAVEAASAIRDALAAAGIPIRAGIHTGECEISDGKLAGLAVSIGARIASLAAPGEVLVSCTVRDLVEGSGLQLEDRGPHELRGIPEAWRLFAVDR